MKISTLLIPALSLAACQADTRNLSDKLDKIDKKLDALIANGGGGRGAARPQRAEPDRAKTYAVAIDGDPTIGAPDAKITLIEAFDYA
jgi:hypothetical protein